MAEVTIKNDESFENALKRFRRKCQVAGVMTEMKKRAFYDKPSVKRKKKQAAAVRKLKKRMRYS